MASSSHLPNQTFTDAAAKSDFQPPLLITKRKRGRPKKGFDVDGQPKKKRGRPPKPKPEKPLEPQPEAQVCKKKRGRPPKASKANLGEETCVPLVTHIMLRRSAGDVQALSETEARLQEQVEALNEKLRCEKEKFEDLSSQHNQLRSLCQEKESALQDALDCHQREKEARIALEKDREQQIMELGRLTAKTRRLEEELEQAESRLNSELSSIQDFELKCQDAANEADDKVADVRVALDVWKDTFPSWRI